MMMMMRRTGAILLQQSLVARTFCTAAVRGNTFVGAAATIPWRIDETKRQKQQQLQQMRGFNSIPKDSDGEAPIVQESQQQQVVVVVQKDGDASVASHSVYMNEEEEEVEDDQELWERRLNDALDQYESVKKMKKSDNPVDHHNRVVQSLEQIRDCYLNLRYWDDALRMEQNLLVLARTLPEQADCHHRMGSLYLQQLKWSQGRKSYQQAYQLYQEIHSDISFHRDFGKMLIGLGGILVQEGNPEQALPFLQQAEDHYRYHGRRRHDVHDDDNDKTILTSSSQEPHPEIIICVKNQALIHRLMGQHQVAIEKYKEIVSYLDEHDNDDLKRDEYQFYIADCLLSIQQFDPALDLLERLLQRHLKRTTTTTTTPTAQEGVLRHLIGVTYSKQGRMEEALQQLESANVIKKSTLGDYHPDVAPTLNGLGAVHASLGNQGEALLYFRESLHIARIHANHDDGHDKDPQVMQTLRNISLVRGDKVPKWD